MPLLHDPSCAAGRTPPPRAPAACAMAVLSREPVSTACSICRVPIWSRSASSMPATRSATTAASAMGALEPGHKARAPAGPLAAGAVVVLSTPSVSVTSRHSSEHSALRRRASRRATARSAPGGPTAQSAPGWRRAAAGSFPRPERARPQWAPHTRRVPPRCPHGQPAAQRPHPERQATPGAPPSPAAPPVQASDAVFLGAPWTGGPTAER
eukprot:scaffold14801_cov105-Isochrysis_galbana.AAC.11